MQEIQDKPFVAEVHLPDDLIRSIVLNEVRDAKLQPLYLSFKEVAKISGLHDKRLLATLRYFEDSLDARKGGPVFYPVNGQGYKIDYQTFCKFCRKHTEAIWNLEIPK